MYIVRHGETAWNAARRMQGHSDIDLNDMGVSQARKLAKKFKTIKFDAAFSSDLLRAKRTAEIVALEHNLVVETTEAIRERFFGHMEGKSIHEIQDELKYVFKEYVNAQEKALLEKKVNKEFVNSVETVEKLTERFTLFLRELAVTYMGKTVLVVCHGGIMSHFIEHLGYMKNIRILNTGYMKVQSDGTEFFVRESEGIVEWVD
jgi:broad specificity phosphatase PhoE